MSWSSQGHVHPLSTSMLVSQSLPYLGRLYCISQNFSPRLEDRTSTRKKLYLHRTVSVLNQKLLKSVTVDTVEEIVVWSPGSGSGTSRTGTGWLRKKGLLIGWNEHHEQVQYQRVQVCIGLEVWQNKWY